MSPMGSQNAFLSHSLNKIMHLGVWGGGLFLIDCFVLYCLTP